jgi:hypothetical protein
MRPLTLVLPALLALGALSCYTRLNHPLLMQQSRIFTPALDSDCAACHATDPWFAALEEQGPLELASPDPLHAFREGAWWRSGGDHALAVEEGRSAAPVADPLPVVMPTFSQGPRRQAALVDTSAGPGRERPLPISPRQRKTGAGKKTVDADSSRKELTK